MVQPFDPANPPDPSWLELYLPSGVRRFNPERPLDPNEPLDLNEIIGGGYEKFWNFTGRYRVLKGSRNSKKSMIMTYWTILQMMEKPMANMLVIRNTALSHRDSTFPVFELLINYLGLADEWKINSYTLRITRVSTGQEIRFGGLDTPYKFTSMGVAHGKLCWVWVEEAWEIENYKKIQVIDQSLRGDMPPGLFNQMTFTFNPWKPFWAKSQYFDRCDRSLPTYDAEFAKGCLCMTTTIDCNEWATKEDYAVLDAYEKMDEQQWRVVRYGEWGVPGGTIYTDWDILTPTVPDYLKERYMDIYPEEKRREVIYKAAKERTLNNIFDRYPAGKHICGLDFGFEHETALVDLFVDKRSHQVWVCNEVVMHRYYDRLIGEKLLNRGYRKSLIIADNADPKAIQELINDFNFTNLCGSRKGSDSVSYGIQFIRGYKIHILADCVKTIEEIKLYCYDTDPVTGEPTDEPIDENDHCMDAMRYAMTFIARDSGFDTKRVLYALS